MKLVVVLALAAACAAPPSRKPQPRPQPQPETATEPPLPGRPVPTSHAIRDVIESPHGGTIVQLAATADGNVALTADELGGIRLWPALDGSKEPRVLDLPLPKQLAIGKLADGFTAVSRDEVGGLYIAKLDREGRVRSHVTHGADPAFTGMAMTSRGLLAWRADQTLMVIDGDGVVTAQLPTEPRQRVLSVAVSGERVLVLLEREDAKQGVRWLTLGPKLAWGAWLDIADPIDGHLIALSPGAKRFVVTKRLERHSTLTAFDIGKKTTIANATQTQLGGITVFTDDDTIAASTSNTVSWLDLKAAKPTLASGFSTVSTRAHGLLAAGGGRAITATNGELVLATPAGAQYLGYELQTPRVAQAGLGGQLLVGVGDSFSLLDRELRATGAASLALPKGSQVFQLRHLAGQEWLVEAMKSGGQVELSLVDVVSGTSTLLRSLTESYILAYEPSTQLATLSFGPSSEVAKLDVKGRKLDRLSGHSRPSPYEQVLLVPVSPALASGVQLVHVLMRDKPTIKWLKDARALDKAAATVSLEGSFAAADAAGYVYMWRATGDKLELAVYRDGKSLAVLPADGPISLWPAPTGGRVAMIAQHSVALFEATGKQIWLQELGGAQEALWLDDGGLAITSAGGIARLDPATGEVKAARCGWRFGLAAKPHPATSRIEPLCSQRR